MTEQRFEAGDVVQLLIEYNGNTGQICKVVEVFEKESLTFYDVSMYPDVKIRVAAYEVQSLPTGTRIWAAESETAEAGTGSPYLKLGVREESGKSVWWNFEYQSVTDGEIQLPAVLVYRPDTKSVKEGDTDG